MITRRVFGFPTLNRNMFEEMEQMRRDMGRLFENFSGGRYPETGTGVFPLINLTEDKDNYYVRAELPGIDTEDLGIQVTGKTLSVSGERKIPEENEHAKYHRREREAGKFSRIISLPGDIDSEKTEAALADGILTVTISKAEKAKPRQITIK